MSINSKVLAAATTLLLLVSGAAVASGTTPAFASSGHEVCDEGFSAGLQIYCLNAWNGGPDIRTYTPGVSNNNFVVQGVDRCNHGDYSTSNCPISGNPSGLFIYQIEYVGGGTYNGDCLGDNTGNLPSDAQMVRCNSTSYPGSGGGTATIFVAFHGDGNFFPYCDSGFNYAVNAHWTNLRGGWNGEIDGIAYADVNDVPVVLSNFPDNCLSYTPFG